MSGKSDKIEELISLKRVIGCESDGLTDWSFKIGRFRFEKCKNMKNKHQQYDIYFLGESIYKEFQKPCGYSKIDFFCLDKEKMSIVIKKTLDEEIEKETKMLRKKEENIFRNCGKIGIFKRIYNFIWRVK
jgi:hypothetical protein